MKKTEVIILAGGYGKRMNSDLPKALIPLAGKPLIMHVIDAVKASGVSVAPIIVVGQKREQIVSALGDDYRFAVQEEQLGTGHAVACAILLVDPLASSVLVLYADHPYISPITIKKIVETRENENATISMATTTLDDFSGWFNVFNNFGRVKRDAYGATAGIVESKDATDEEKKITEVNPAYFCFEKNWLIEFLPKIKNDNAQKEYYLTDLVKLAVEEGKKIVTVPIEAKEALGTNSKEDIELAESI
jgi:bifunctional UDP-N-acetylglucosamine pyrophosphorylase/glucosamine-1-phosphate N-acetyltransferase